MKSLIDRDSKQQCNMSYKNESVDWHYYHCQALNTSQESIREAG